MKFIVEPFMLVVRGTCLVVYCIAAMGAQAQETEASPAKVEELPKEVLRDLRLKPFRDNPPVFQASKSGEPTVVGGTAPPKLTASVVARDYSASARQLEVLVTRVRADGRFRDAVKNVNRAEFLGGRAMKRDKDESGEEVIVKGGLLRFFAYEINRVVSVDVDGEGRVVDLRVREQNYQASLSKDEVKRAESIARGDSKAPKDLSRFPIARALVRPPDASGARIAYVMFRHPDSLVWRYEGFVDLSTNQLREINRVK